MNIPNELAHQVCEILILHQMREEEEYLNEQGIAALLSLKMKYTAKEIKEITDRYVKTVLKGENG